MKMDGCESREQASLLFMFCKMDKAADEALTKPKRGAGYQR
jgi:hypothetical protein